jgi:hypothetical protein
MAAGDTATANASASVTLYAPITIAAADTLRFGKVAKTTAATGGSIVIYADGTVPLVTTLSDIGTQDRGPATFNITGTSGASFGIVLGTPTATAGEDLVTVTAPTIGTAAASGMTLVGTTGTLTAATATLKLGATLTIAATAVGNSTPYASTIPVTVTYQ